MIPVLRPLKDPAVATVWSGLAVSTIGEDLFRVAVVWIAAEQIGNAAGYVNAAQYGAMLAVGLLGASLFDRWRADRAMIGAKLFGPDVDSVIMGSAAFGHVGAGGSLGFADPAAGLSFGYTMNRMGPGLLMNERGQALVDAAYLSLGYTNKDGGVWVR
ncbi:MAG TPA: hypothetical protein VE527_06190 [Reyranella sp.]|nr:hypothetical protein [Reyranella sp.]